MRRILKTLVLAAAVVAMFSASGQAFAHGPRNNFSGAYGFGYSGTLYGLGYIPVPPYHAIHPPVYYGQRVRRSYGRSPFAAQPAAIKDQALRPRIVVNKTMKADPKPAEETATSSQTAVVGPQLILNPFVTQEPSRLVSQPR